MESDGLALQRRLPGLCQNWLMPAIERVLERCAPPDGHHLTIERLEIDAGSLTLERLEHDLAESVAQAIEKSLREQIASIPPHESSSMHISGNVQRKTAQQSVHAAFIYFLKIGSLPWLFRLPHGRSLEQTVLDSWQQAASSNAEIYAMQETVRHVLISTAARKRLIQQFSPIFLETLLALLSPENKKIMDSILKTLHSADQSFADSEYFERYLWEKIFLTLAECGTMTSASLVSKAWRVLPAIVRHADLAKLLERQWPGATDDVSGGQPGIEPNQSSSAALQAALNINEHPDAVEGLYIENAGIVLLHPFLPRLFEALGITAEDRLLQPERALCLLHFLATGQSIAPEYELVLPKILCGIPLETPVDSRIELSDAEKEEATALLEAVIHHWEILRDTSADGLRGTFLIRSGKVSLRKDDDWLLQVETKSYDILMDDLPWSISIIRLPWMHRMLWVEWV